MDYSRRELSDRLAAEYVLGTLQGGARRRFEALLPAHPGLRSAVWRWQDRLVPLTASVPPVTPSAAVWRGIEQRIFGETATADAATSVQQRITRWWERLGLWQGLAGAASLATLALAVALSLPGPVQPPVVVVMGTEQGPASFVASVGADGRSLVLKPLAGVTVTAAQALELWAVPPKGAPRSLGLVSNKGATTVLREHLLQGTAAFAVSVEPTGGSPTGAPTGPVVSVGHLEL
ncbi:anti-sigma factor domain-containing protein [Sphaerotilus sp.]|uniref:anti-sigma factor n=1 Tax=Sphaerotilus sp. TaxID=2093942 RepID=UPI002ACD539F|nr:anti-sigma factor [Sphaerotilus sp.]MDZ7857942.1 anti-sigma factor [Sphaerotilus sp.]